MTSYHRIVEQFFITIQLEILFILQYVLNNNKLNSFAVCLFIYLQYYYLPYIKSKCYTIYYEGYNLIDKVLTLQVRR